MSIQPRSIWMDIGLDAEMVCTKAGMPVESSLEFYFLCTPMQIPCNFNKKPSGVDNAKLEAGNCVISNVVSISFSI